LDDTGATLDLNSPRPERQTGSNDSGNDYESMF